ncbi:MAG: pseudouridine synthase [Lachnospiraceae bacterium]|nr:pseudouridine synthase [Lachnospiraceae bacterium]
MIRLDKFLSEMNIGTRSEIKELVKKKRIEVNGEIIQKPEKKVNPMEDSVCFDGDAIVYEPFVYYLLNKPAGVVSAVKDNLYETVIDLLKQEKREDLFPVGRLDKDTEGLLLITNDGEIAHNLLSPKKHVDKTYYAKVSGYVKEEDIVKFRNGLSIGEKNNTLPATLDILKNDEISEVLVTIKEGKFHQIKRMFQAISKEVLYLRRISMGSLQLPDDLPTGTYRRLTDDEINQLKHEES